MLHKVAPHLLNILSSRKMRSPDLHSLAKQGDTLVFVYGTLKSGHMRHSALAGSHSLGRATTLGVDFEMRDSGNRYPIVFENTNALTSGRIVGEAYVCPLDVIQRLDTIEGNGTLYYRKRVWVSLLDQINIRNGSNISAQALIYMQKDSPSRSQLNFVHRDVKTYGDDTQRYYFYKWYPSYERPTIGD